jgi:hypothetical protein
VVSFFQFSLLEPCMPLSSPSYVAQLVPKDQ